MLIRWFVLFVLLAMPASAQQSHMTSNHWYPFDCCSGQDCSPVERAEVLPNGEVLVTSKQGAAVIPEAFPKRVSLDHQMHVCMRRGAGGAMRLLCVFLPPPS